MKKILAIGGAVIRTAKQELIEVIKSDQVEMFLGIMVSITLILEDF